MLQVTPEEVQHVARLARLHLQPDEVPRMAAELSRIVDYMAQLQQVDTTGVQPMEQPEVTVQRVRRDVVRRGLRREAALARAPRSRAGFFSVPKVLR
ncbi:MAG: Asp-tRNA(Asn)/Glu-tRNA(Gln) amidotransferase subunit GatC [bacterium]|nr:Asp-tRNA(Asn)/Glu-tRNA(Gln) amidotransferase subunit GatC [candidate division KSB1 bacterium]MDH7560283.1 Asp-tRNA(Asn)/Glu-tRNA(Gln) amidotransferase subunit GatC [bacterium]